MGSVGLELRQGIVGNQSSGMSLGYIRLYKVILGYIVGRYLKVRDVCSADCGC
jgi:hypothetical protein